MPNPCRFGGVTWVSNRRAMAEVCCRIELLPVGANHGHTRLKPDKHRIAARYSTGYPTR